MSAHRSPPFKRRQLGRQLRDLREAARISPGEACDRLELSAARLSRMETGQTAPDIVMVKSLLDLYGIPVNDWEPVLDLAREAKRKGWWQAYGLSAMGYIALETAASSVRDFALAYVPGLMQTREYATAVLSESIIRRKAHQLEDDVTVRMLRQHRLSSDEDTLELTAIVDEGVLCRPVGGTAVMRAQLGHMIELAELRTVSLQVAPTEVGWHRGMMSSFTVLGFPTADDADVVHMEHVAGALQLEKPEEVRSCILTFERLRTLALNPHESVELIERVMHEF